MGLWIGRRETGYLFYKRLLNQAQQHLSQNPVYIKQGFWFDTFPLGAKWMVDRLNEIDPAHHRVFNQKVSFTAYGLGKYLLCLLAFSLYFMLFLKIHWLLTPLAILVFYIFEVSLLFLFPLLIDQVKHPLITSFKMTWNIGFSKTILIILPIAIFMLKGLFDNKGPFHNWHIGCLVILFWYVETRN